MSRNNRSVPFLSLVPVFSLLAALLLLSCTTRAAGFDCTKASTQIEKAVCADDEVSALDERMSEAFEQRLKVSTDTRALRRSQRKWLRSIRDSCTGIQTRECLVAAYASRIAFLRRSEDDEHALSLTEAEAARICHTVAVETKTRRIRERYVSAKETPSGVEFSGLDIDGDQLVDDVTVSSGSSESLLEIRLSSGGYFEHADGLMTLLRLNSRTYVLVTSRSNPPNGPESIAHSLSLLGVSGLLPVCDAWWQTTFVKDR